MRVVGGVRCVSFISTVEFRWLTHVNLRLIFLESFSNCFFVLNPTLPNENKNSGRVVSGKNYALNMNKNIHKMSPFVLELKQ